MNLGGVRFGASVAHVDSKRVRQIARETRFDRENLEVQRYLSYD